MNYQKKPFLKIILAFDFHKTLIIEVLFENVKSKCFKILVVAAANPETLCLLFGINRVRV